MKRALGLLLVLALTAAACGGDDGGVTDPAAANSCADLAEVTINATQEAIDAFDEMSIADFAELGETGEMPEALMKFETLGDQLEQRAGELGCSEEEVRKLTCDRIGDLKSSGDFGELMLAEFASEC